METVAVPLVLAEVLVESSGELTAEDVRDWLAANTLFRAVPFTVDGFVLFSSTPGRHGSTYTAECRFPVEG